MMKIILKWKWKLGYEIHFLYSLALTGCVRFFFLYSCTMSRVTNLDVHILDIG
jgi:hypothetical protein